MTPEEKLRNTVLSIALFISEQHPEYLAPLVNKHRTNLSNAVAGLHGNVVAYGPFKGLKLDPNPRWGGGDRGTMVLGLYEKEILDLLVNLASRYRTFIDLGAADGYYGIGVLINRVFDRSYCFEISAEGREVLKRNAMNNKVADRTSIFGEATKDFPKLIPEADRHNCVMLVDIEGAEFDLLGPSVFSAFSGSTIIVEIHNWVQNAEPRLEAMKVAAKATHKVSEVRAGPRDSTAYKETMHLNDNDRWLFFSEGRPTLMHWLVFDPI